MNKKSTFRELIAKYRNRKIYVGFSGGADSTLLLLKLLDLQKELNLDITAVHFDHGLRENARKEANWCQKFCEKNNVKFAVYKLNVCDFLNGKRNIEAVCRELRLKKYAEIVDKKNSVIALGHHKNDRFENLLMRIFRGGNVSGITSLRREQLLSEMLFIRPLLGYKRVEIVENLQINYNLTDFCCDESNNDNLFFRNFLRNNFLNNLFEKFPHAQKGIEHSLKCLEEDALFIENLADQRYKDLAKKYQLEQNVAFKIEIEDFLEMPNALRFRVLKVLLTKKTSGRFLCDYHFFQRFNEMLEKINCSKNGEAKFLEMIRSSYYLKFQNNQISLENNCEQKVKSSSDLYLFKLDEMVGVHNFGQFGEFEIKIYRKGIDFEFEQQLSNAFCNKNSLLLFFDGEKAQNNLVFRFWQNGDYIIPFGKKSSKLLKVKKIFTDKKIPKEQRHIIPILTSSNNDLIWIVGIRVSAQFAVSDSTKKLVVIRFCQ